MMSKVALITGITGQDGSYLADLLLEKGYEVHGIVRRASLINTHRIDHIYNDLHLHYGDLTDATNIIGVIKKIELWDKKELKKSYKEKILKAAE